jgi:hypothetical protein
VDNIVDESLFTFISARNQDFASEQRGRCKSYCCVTGEGLPAAGKCRKHPEDNDNPGMEFHFCIAAAEILPSVGNMHRVSGCAVVRPAL